MRKVHCDRCGSVIEGPIKILDTSVTKCGVIIVFRFDGRIYRDEELDICKYCLIDELKKLDDRHR
jgi:hypothetical protein